MQELVDRGGDPDRLRELQAAFNAEHQLQVKVLTIMRGEQDRARLWAWVEQRAELLKRLEAAICRQDLTIPEARLVDDLLDKLERQLRNGLLAEPQHLEQKPPPVKRR